MKKKVWVCVFALMMSLASGCKKDNSTISFDNLYDYSAISGISLLNLNYSKSLSLLAYNESEKEEIINNLKIVEDVLKNEMIKSEEKSSDRDGFTTMYSITTTGLDGKKENYEFYYSEKSSKQDEDEVETLVEGIVIFDEVEYEMIGKKESEEDEVEMTFKIIKDEQNYVLIEQEIESDEQEFKYSYYQNGRKVYEKELEFEKENNKIEIEFKEKDSSNKKTYKYEFINKNNKQYVKVKIKVGKSKDVISVEISKDENGNVNYIIIE